MRRTRLSASGRIRGVPAPWHSASSTARPGGGPPNTATRLTFRVRSCNAEALARCEFIMFADCREDRLEPPRAAAHPSPIVVWVDWVPLFFGLIYVYTNSTNSGSLSICSASTSDRDGHLEQEVVGFPVVRHHLATGRGLDDPSIFSTDVNDERISAWRVYCVLTKV
jgi:hypothetical protein